MLCGQLGVEPNALLDFELCLADTQPGVSRFVFMLDKYPKDFSFAFYSFFFWGFAQNCADIKRISMQGTFVLSKEDCCYFYPTEEKPLNVRVVLPAEWNITLENLEGTRLRALIAFISIWFTHKITVRAAAMGSLRGFLTDYHEFWHVFVLCRH